MMSTMIILWYLIQDFSWLKWCWLFIELCVDIETTGFGARCWQLQAMAAAARGFWSLKIKARRAGEWYRTCQGKANFSDTKHVIGAWILNVSRSRQVHRDELRWKALHEDWIDYSFQACYKTACKLVEDMHIAAELQDIPFEVSSVLRRRSPCNTGMVWSMFFGRFQLTGVDMSKDQT